MRASFAVVGHPNKGKSSIVSTLAQNDRIEISSRSGTTTHTNVLTVETARSSYQLIDTPGFQRPGKVLSWLKDHAQQADQRAQAVADFVENAECQQRFPDEVELLTPLVQGAAILYVVDGSRPYGKEYEAEMEILQWTGRPSMALINPIENESHVDTWNSALLQYFKTVRVFNPMKAEFEKQIELLLTFAHLKPEWSDELRLVTEDLKEKRAEQAKKSAILLARLIEDLCHYQQRQKVMDQTQAQALQPVLAEQYHRNMKQMEQKAIKELFAIYAHFQAGLQMDDLALPPDLFDCEHWFVWGLNKRQLATVSALSGAAAGAAIDLAVAGHSLMLGAIGGGVVGLGSALWGADKLVETRVQGLPLGGYEACYGPIKNINFPYVMIGRFLYLHTQISQRNHALRDNIEVNSQTLQMQISQLEKSEQKALHLACRNLIRQKPLENLPELLRPLLITTVAG